jgi:uncharacterized membrane protein
VIGIPLYAWWLDVSLIKAFMLNIGFVVFFLFYSFSYNWAFDTVFGLPTSARAGRDIRRWHSIHITLQMAPAHYTACSLY